MKKELVIIIVLSFLTILSFPFDNSFSNFIVEHRTPILDSFMKIITLAIVEIIILLILVLFIFFKDRDLKEVFLLVLIIFVTLFISSVLKFIIARPRPDVVHLVKESSFSFPSNHSSAAFSAIPLFFKENGTIGYVWLIISIIIAFSRVYTGVHYLSDVLAGALLGYVISISIIKLDNNYNLTKKLIRIWFIFFRGI